MNEESEKLKWVTDKLEAFKKEPRNIIENVRFQSGDPITLIENNLERFIERLVSFIRENLSNK